MNRTNEVACSPSNLSLLLFAARALVCSILALVLVAGGAHASTLSLTQTSGGPTLVGTLDAVTSFSFGGGNGQFVSALDTVGVVIAQDTTNGFVVFELDLTGTGIGDLAFQNVLFTSFALGGPVGGIPIETVSFTYGTLAITPEATPLPAALPLFAGGLGALGLLGWRRKKKATALAA